MGIFMEKNGKAAVFFAAFALGLYLVFRYLLPLAGPFVLAFFAVYLIWPWLERIRKKLPIKQEIMLASILLFLSAALCLGIWVLLRQSADLWQTLYQKLLVIEAQLVHWLHGGCLFLEKNFGIDAKMTEALIIERMEIFADQLQVNIWPTAAKQSFSYLKQFGKAMAFGGIVLIAMLLLCRDFDRIRMKMRSHPAFEIVWQFLEKTVQMVGGYVKAQLLIICAVSAAAVSGLWISRVNGPLFWGLLAGMLDALPFIGTSIVLIPLAVWQILNGSIWSAAGVVICYILCIIVRELLEPRLLGRQLGIAPVIMLFSVYAGVKVFGISGLFLGPLYVMLLQEGCRMYWNREA